MSQELKSLDLFSGIGGFALASEWAGIRTMGFAEINPYAAIGNSLVPQLAHVWLRAIAQIERGAIA